MHLLLKKRARLWFLWCKKTQGKKKNVEWRILQLVILSWRYVDTVFRSCCDRLLNNATTATVRINVKHRKIKPSISLNRSSSIDYCLNHLGYLSSLLIDIRELCVCAVCLSVQSVCVCAVCLSVRQSESISFPADLYICLFLYLFDPAGLCDYFFVNGCAFLLRWKRIESIACTQCLKKLATPFSSTLEKWWTSFIWRRVDMWWFPPHTNKTKLDNFWWEYSLKSLQTQCKK